MQRIRYRIFQTLDEAGQFCSSTSVAYKYKLIKTNHVVDSLNSQYAIWGAPSLYFLELLLRDLYEMKSIYLNYDNLNLLERHGLAHMVITVTSAYIENREKHILLAGFHQNDVIRTVYLPIVLNDLKKSTKVGRNAEVFYTDTLEKSKERIPPNIKTGNELQEWLSTELQVSHWDFFNKELFEDYDPNFIGYFGNYVHPKLKKIIGNEELWQQIKTYRNLLAHPQEKLNEKVLIAVCDILTSESFVENIEKVVFLLLPLLPKERQAFVDTGEHGNKSEYREVYLS